MRSDRDPPNQDSAWQLSERIALGSGPCRHLGCGLVLWTWPQSSALPWEGQASLCAAGWAEGPEKHLESPCPFYTQDLTVPAKGPGEGPAEWQRSPAELGGDPEGSGSDAGTRDGGMLPCERCQRT